MKPASRCSSPFDVTSKVVDIDSNPGLTFYELYMTEGVPKLTGLRAGPDAPGTKAFPGPGGTMFRLISYPPKRPEGYKPPPGVTFESALKELSDKVPGMGDHFERGAPGMHTSDTIDLRGRGSRRDDAGTGRRTEGPFAPGRLHRAERQPAIAGAIRCPEPCLMDLQVVGLDELGRGHRSALQPVRARQSRRATSGK